MLYRHEQHGWTDSAGKDYVELEAAGWVKTSDEEFKEYVAAKSGKQAQKADIIQPVTQREAERGKPGRKPKNLASLGGINGNSSNSNQS